MNRAERKRAAREQSSQKPIKGWVIHPVPVNLQQFGHGWFTEIEKVYRSDDNFFVVMIRKTQTEWGEVEHAIIKNIMDNDVPWREKQRIKNEIFGHERIAIEVFPKTSELVDAAPLYHLWILPENMSLPFGLN